jgi:hypothetical protein
MSKSRKPGRPAKPVPQPARQRLPLLAGIALAVVLVAAGAYWWSQPRQPDPRAAFQKLQGRWQRTDAGYVIDIRSVDTSGKMSAAYFNPRPINVARSEASLDGQTARVFIELRDVNYPGSTYTLTYDPRDDGLKGMYFQAVARETFAVSFTRMKP